MRERWFLTTLTLFFVGLMVFAPSSARPMWEFLTGTESEALSRGRDLTLENEVLRAELAKLRSMPSSHGGGSHRYEPAFIYSRYPFRSKKEFIVSRGANDGVSTGLAVVLPVADGGARLVGKVEKVFESTALVLTVFDPRFTLPVRVGEQGIDALLVGGSEPHLAYIEKTAPLASGAVVYAASADFPYGLSIGDVLDVRDAADQLFTEATVRVAYDLHALKAVYILHR